jgi:hypothetical protein
MPSAVYNLEVQVDHVYHVGTAGVLVHNTTPMPPVFVDENVFFMVEELKKAGYDVRVLPSGTLDPEIRKAVEEAKGILVTRNYKDFKGMSQVVRVGDGVKPAEQLEIVKSTLETIQKHPDIWDKLGKQLPASGLNKGHFKLLCPK